MSYTHPYHQQQQQQQQQQHHHQQQQPNNPPPIMQHPQIHHQPYSHGGAYMNTTSHLPSLHEQSPYRTQQQHYANRTDMPSPRTSNNQSLHMRPQQQQRQQQQQQQANTEHYQHPLPSLYESRKLYTCGEIGCSEYFDHPNSLRIHQRSVHGSVHGRDNGQDDHGRPSQTRPYVCPYSECGKSFTQYGNLKTHSRKHTGERPYHCTYDGCDKAFTQLGNLKTHEKIHWPVKPFMCAYPNCGKGFTQRGNLKTHQVKVHQVVPQ